MQRSRVGAQAQNALRGTLQRVDDLRRQVQNRDSAYRSQIRSMTQQIDGLTAQRDAATAAYEADRANIEANVRELWERVMSSMR